MYFIEYSEYDLDGEIRPALGDRGVIIVDGRESASVHHNIARREGAKRGFPFYRICKGVPFHSTDRATRLHSCH